MRPFSFDNISRLFLEDRHQRHFLGLFKSKKGPSGRPGALPPEDVKRLVQEIGEKKKVNIYRVQYDGTPEDKPVTVQILDIREDYFTGEVVNVERSIKEEMDNRLVYSKGGGGTIDFYYTDGDVMKIEQDVDEIIIQQKNETELLEILDALDLNESILISFYDRTKGGVLNGTGKLITKDVAEKNFEVELNLINDIELDKPKTVSLNIDKDTVLDLEVVI